MMVELFQNKVFLLIPRRTPEPELRHLQFKNITK